MLIYSSESVNEVLGELPITKIWIKKFKQCHICGRLTVWKIRRKFNKFYTSRYCYEHLPDEAKKIISEYYAK